MCYKGIIYIIWMKVNPAFCYKGRGGKERRPWENPFANWWGSFWMCSWICTLFLNFVSLTETSANFLVCLIKSMSFISRVAKPALWNKLLNYTFSAFNSSYKRLHTKITQDTFTPNHEMENSMSVLEQYPLL